MACAESGDVKIGALQPEIFGSLLHVGFAVERRLLGDEDLLWLWRDRRWLLGRLRRISFQIFRQGELSHLLLCTSRAKGIIVAAR